MAPKPPFTIPSPPGAVRGSPRRSAALHPPAAFATFVFSRGRLGPKPKSPARTARRRLGKCYRENRESLRVRARLAQTEHAVAFLPLATTLENFHALETLKNVALGRDGAGTFKTAMLGHKFWKRGAETSVPAPLRKPILQRNRSFIFGPRHRRLLSPRPIEVTFRSASEGPEGRPDIRRLRQLPVSTSSIRSPGRAAAIRPKFSNHHHRRSTARPPSRCPAVTRIPPKLSSSAPHQILSGVSAPQFLVIPENQQLRQWPFCTAPANCSRQQDSR